MSAPIGMDIERDICRDYGLQENGKFVHSRDSLAEKYGVSTHTISQVAMRNGIRRYVDNQKERKVRADTPKPTLYTCPFCGFKCESPAGHEVCR